MRYSNPIVIITNAAQAVALVIRLTKEYGIRTHIVHLSSSDAIDLVAQVRFLLVSLARRC